MERVRAQSRERELADRREIAITGRTTEDRLPASLAAALLAVQGGARILRVHDVAATRDVLAVWHVLETA